MENIINHYNNCYELIGQFIHALGEKDYNKSLSLYSRLGEEAAIIAGNVGDRVESIIQKIIIAEFDSIKKLGEYLNSDNDVFKIGNLKMVYLENALKGNEYIISSLLMDYQKLIDEDIKRKDTCLVTFRSDDIVGVFDIRDVMAKLAEIEGN